MSLKTVVMIEIIKNDRTFTFTMPHGTPVGECLDAAFNILDELKQLTADIIDRNREKTGSEEIKSYGGTD